MVSAWVRSEGIDADEGAGPFFISACVGIEGPAEQAHCTLYVEKGAHAAGGVGVYGECCMRGE